MAQLAGDGGRAVRRHGRDVPRGTRGRLDQGGGRHVVEAQAIRMTLRAVAGDAGVPGRTHGVHGVVARGGVTLGARRIRRNVIGRLGAAAVLVRVEGRGGRVTAVAVTRGRVALVVSGR